MHACQCGFATNVLVPKSIGVYLFSSWHMLGEFDFSEVPFANGLDETIFPDVRLIGAVSWHGWVQNGSVDVIVGALYSTLK